MYQPIGDTCGICRNSRMPNPQEGRPQRPRRLSGMALFILSMWNAASPALLLTAVPSLIVIALRQETSPRYLIPLMVLVPVSLVMAVRTQRQLDTGVTSHLLARLSDQRPTGDGDYVLYLRSFFIDNALARPDPAGGAHFLTSLVSSFGYRDPSLLDDTWESRLAHLLRRFGPVVAVGRPGEPLPLPGARRFYLPPEGDKWQQDVGHAIGRARLAAVVAAVGEGSANSRGTLWEYSESVRQLPPSRVLLIACGGRDAYERFRASAVEYFADRAVELAACGKTLPPPPVLPDWPEPQRPRKVRRGFPLHGVVRFRSDWTAEFVHFDPTGQRGPTPNARWRKAVRTQVDPWLGAFEQDLPGFTVEPARIRYHWHLKLPAALVVGLITVLLVVRWNDIALSQKCAVLLLLASIFTGLGRGSASVRGMSRDVVQVRSQRDDRVQDDAPASNDPVIEAVADSYVATESIVRWPGRRGLGLLVLRWYRDTHMRYVDAPSRPFYRALTATRELEPFRTTRVWPVGFVLRTRMLAVVQTDRDIDMTSTRFGLRWLLRLAGLLGTVIGTTVGLFRVRSGGQMLAVAAIGALTAYWFWFRSHQDHDRMRQLRLQPVVPRDLAREPCVLYLRPHPGDPVPQSAWQGPLDTDLNTVFDAPALFRVGHIADLTPPPPQLARLPLPPQDWKRTLTTALPHCHLVIIPTIGTAPETLWQLTEAIRLLPPSRVLLLLPSGADCAEEYARFRQAAVEAFAERAATAPDDERPYASPSWLPISPPHASPCPGTTALRGVIHFDSSWQPKVVTFPVVDTSSGAASHGESRHAQLLRIRAQLQPLLPELPSGQS
ncbi:MAG: hypothetical protein HOV92_24690 [Streptomyces sp.]|nr:hypothetical protein [Streptomyces sp.]